MAGLGILLYGVASAIAGISRAVENEQTKARSRRVNEKGQVVCYDSKMNRYINGEKTYQYTEYDKYNHPHALTIGCDSGKVYEDRHDRYQKRMDDWTKSSYDHAIEWGELAYTDYSDPRFDRVTREISTGKIITCLYETVSETRETEYRKFYLTDNLYKKFGKEAWQHTEEGDYGIVITREEYYKLGGNIAYTSHIPSDDKVLHYFWKRLGFK